MRTPGKLLSGFCLVQLDPAAQFLNDFAAPFDVSKHSEAINQQDAKTMLLRAFHPELFSQGGCFAATISITIRSCEIVFQFDNRFLDCLLNVWAGRSDIA